MARPTGKPRLPPRDPGRRWPPCRDPRKGGRLCAGQPWGCVPSRHPYTQLLGASALRPFPRELDTPRLRPLAAPGARNSGDQRATGQQHRRQEPPTAAESELEKSLHGERGRLRASVSTGGGCSQGAGARRRERPGAAQGGGVAARSRLTWPDRGPQALAVCLGTMEQAGKAELPAVNTGAGGLRRRRPAPRDAGRTAAGTWRGRTRVR